MPWTTPTDHTASLVSIAEWNQHMGASGNSAYLKAAVDTPMRAKKDGGATVGGRAAINFVTGSNVVLTVADDAGNNEIDVTIAASGSTFPTLASAYATSGIPDPGSGYPTYSTWVEFFSSTSADVIGLIISLGADPDAVSLFYIGTGASPTAKIFLPNIGSGTGLAFERQIIYVPFSIPSGTKISVACYYLASGGALASLTLMS